MSHYLPSRVSNYLLRLTYQYARTAPLLNEIITASRVLVVEETGYDNWNGGQHGHDVRLYVPIEFLGKIDIDDQLQTASTIHDDLRKLTQSVEGEYIAAVRLEMEDDNDPDCQRAKPFSARPVVNPDTLTIWKPGLVRVFISHRDGHKAKAHYLAEALEPYGFSCFVAHDNIPANEEWRRVIVSGLETMEIMLVFLTDDFSDSIWTMQEVGYALGKAVPYVSLKLEARDPPGFINHTQALRGSIEKPFESAGKLAPLLAEALGRRDRMQSALVEAFVASPNWSETTVRFNRMAEVVTKLTDAEVATIVEGFRRNDQLHTAAYLRYKNHDRLRSFLDRATGSIFSVDGRSIEEEIPF